MVRDTFTRADAPCRPRAHNATLAVPLIAMETHGSSCFYQSLAVNPGPFGATPQPPAAGVGLLHSAKAHVKYVSIPKITSRAGSLGASWPSPGAVKMALTRQGGVKSVCVSDEMAMNTSILFAGAWRLPGHTHTA